MRYTGYVDPHALLVIAAMLIWGSLKGIWTGWFVRKTEAVSRKIATQRFRYGMVAFAQALIVAVFVGLYYFIGGLTEHATAYQKFANYGLDWYAYVIAFAVVTLLAAGIASPLFTLAAVISIYRKPAEMAYKRDGGYVPTRLHRKGHRLVTRPVVLLDPENRVAMRSWV